MGKRAQTGPDLSAVPNEACPCGSRSCTAVKNAKLHARQCQHCWRSALPCIAWHTRHQSWLCGSCRTGLDFPPSQQPVTQQPSLFEGGA